MSVMSNRQRRLARKAARQAEAARPQVEAVVEQAVVISDIVDGDVIGAAYLREEAAAKAAVQDAEREAVSQGEKLTAADRRDIRAEYGVSRLTGKDAPAAYRMRSRDGLTSAKDTGVITVALHKAGLAYRLCFEAQAGGLKSALANAGMIGGGRSAAEGLAMRSPAALQQAYLMGRLRGMEGGLSERELFVVRAVAGEGRTARSLGGGGSTRQANLTALVSGLTKVVWALGW
ncbi:hypothetical protein EGY25_04395 [Brevundimonas intermedia]|uniref:Uncharacterized protein n=1 Tax=Brevundimonas intermedia TaxID=74315 RepID=A0A4Y9S4J3_9CAUL|nr:hypothetical protein [Brevundimonas intermedia]TFW14438.1 hypothetical protein EGY25_04395 [Brevundimonas intermedia]